MSRPLPLRILVHGPAIPRPDSASGDRRFVALMKMIARRHHVDFCAAMGPTQLAPPIPEVDVARYVRELRDGGIRVLGWGRPTIFSSLTRGSYDLLFVEFAGLLASRRKLFRWCQPYSPIVVDSVDLEFARLQTAAALNQVTQEEVQRSKEVELSAYRAADAVIVITKEEDEILAAEAPEVRRFILPNIVPIVPRRLAKREPEVLFIGGFRHQPNVDGILWFAQECWPTVLETHPAAKLLVVGSEVPQEVQALTKRPGIEVIGWVPDTAPWLDRAALSIAPLRVGGGMKGKVSEALAHGVPVVTTSIGAQGFEGTNGRHYWIADKSADFAGAVVAALADPALSQEVGLCGQALVENICGPQKVQLLVDQLLENIGGTRSRPQRLLSRLRSVPFRILSPLVRLAV